MKTTPSDKGQNPDYQDIPGFDGVRMPRKAQTTRAMDLLRPEAMTFIVDLHRKFEPERQQLLAQRKERQRAWNAGEVPGYLEQNSPAVTGDWRVAPIPEDLQCRRVEITGPAESAKMVINMLNRSTAGVRADAAMLDLEDALKPSWENILNAVTNIAGAAAGTLMHIDPARPGRAEKEYRLNADDTATMIVRPRGMHLHEINFSVDGSPISAALFDVGLSLFHMVHALMKRGKTPAYYIPKCEHHLEARWWNEVFGAMEKNFSLPKGTIKATFLIETLPAAFQMEEILYEIREHGVGLNVGRWDKIFSDIKSLGYHADRILADRAAITMQKPWMDAYARRCVQICHQRGAFAMGGMSAFTPGSSPEIREAQIAKVTDDKRHEASIGHDGCWVSHPYFIEHALGAFVHQNQLDVKHRDQDKYPDLLPRSDGPKTLAGLRTNVRVGIAYLEGWQRDIGCVAWDNLMEDLATLEISRAQTWQWLHHGVELDDGAKVDDSLVRQIFSEELQKIVNEECEEIAKSRAADRESVVQGFTRAAQTAEEIFTRTEMADFLYEASEPAA